MTQNMSGTFPWCELKFLVWNCIPSVNMEDGLMSSPAAPVGHPDVLRELFGCSISTHSSRVARGHFLKLRSPYITSSNINLVEERLASVPSRGGACNVEQ